MTEVLGSLGSVEEAVHLEAKPYNEEDRIKPPDWYDDTVNVGELANAVALQAEEE